MNEIQESRDSLNIDEDGSSPTGFHPDDIEWGLKRWENHIEYYRQKQQGAFQALPSAVEKFAMGYHMVVLDSGLRGLDNLFQEKEWHVLFSTFMGIGSPSDASNPATNVAYELGLEPDNWETSTWAPLIRKLMEIDISQCVALQHVCQGFWSDPEVRASGVLGDFLGRYKLQCAA